MKGLNVFVALCFVIAMGACCSKKGACPALKFASFRLIGFEAHDVDSVNLIRYRSNTNFTVIIDTTFLKGSPTELPNEFLVNTNELSIDYDYGVQLVKLSRLFKINNFTGKKIACGKCFLRQNNQFGYELNGYSVNNRAQAYDGIVRILK